MSAVGQRTNPLSREGAGRAVGRINFYRSNQLIARG
jgi:hypothetical protein